MADTILKEKVSGLEQMMMELAYESMKTDMALRDFASQMKTFKDEIRNDTKTFKEDMRNDTKILTEKMRNDTKILTEKMSNDTKIFKDEIRNDTKTFKEDMRNDTKILTEKMRNDTKILTEKMRNDTKIFKDEIRNDTKIFKNELNKKWGELANKMGTIVEDIVAPGLKGVARKYFGVEEFDYFTPRIRIRNKDRSVTREFDVIAETEEYFFIVETKASPRTEYISAFIKFLPELGLWFPTSREKKLIPIFASLYLSAENIKYLTNNNIIAMATSDDGMDIYNTEILSKIDVK